MRFHALMAATVVLGLALPTWAGGSSLNHAAFSAPYSFALQPAEEPETADDGMEVDEEVVIAIKSEDVLHSFFLPNVRLKQDVVPGMKQFVWFKPVKEGTYDIVCAELCGWGHYKMKGRMTVESRADFDRWIEQLTEAQNLASYEAN